MHHDTIADLLLDRAADDRVGVLTAEASWSWRDVVRESAARAAMARSLRRSGPFHIGVLLDNVPEYLFWLGGAALSGASIVGVNPTRSDACLEQEVRHADCQLFITDRSGYERIAPLDVGVERDRVLLVDADDYRASVTEQNAEPERHPDVASDTRLLLLFTSGTTGASKAAICSQGRLAGLGHANSVKYDIGRDDVSYCCMPLFHGNALMALWAPSLAAGASIALTPRFSASRFLSEVRSFRATYFTYVGKAIGYVLATPEGSGDAENHLTHGFGTEASPEDRAEFLRRFGARLMEGYGSSEGAGMIKPDPEGPVAALGRPARAGVKVVDPETLEAKPPAILDDHGRVANAEESIGEIIDTEGAAKFEGYYRNEAANAERVRHGWYWTGDLGYLDEDGYIYFAGRSGDWIRVDGENISALLIERVLRRHTGVTAAGVFGVPDPRSGDQVMAAIEVGDDTEFDDLNLLSFLSDQGDLGAKGLPSYLRVSRSLPTTGSNKLRKKEMQLDGWRTDDPVYHRVERSSRDYVVMTSDDKKALEEEFTSFGRQRFLP